MKKQNWFEDVFNLRPHFNQKIEQYIKQVIEVRYKEKGFLSDLEEDQLVERENEIYKQISTLFGGYWQDLDMAFDNPWEVFEDASQAAKSSFPRCLEMWFFRVS